MHIKQIEVPVTWGHIRGQIFGKPTETSTPILALHGYLDNSNSFKPLARHLIKLSKDNKYHIIAIDLPGMGLSSKIPEGIPYSTKFFVMTIRRVVNYLNLTKFLFMTHSFGCSLALAVRA